MNEETYLAKLSILDAKKDGSLNKIADTYNINDRTIQSGYWDENQTHPVITFNQQILYDKSFPLPKIIKEILKLGEKTMGCPVEIEFAGNFSRNPSEKHSLYLLQIRPSIEIPIRELEVLDKIEKEDILAQSITFSGNGIIKNIRDIVYIKSSAFSTLKTLEMASEIDDLNKKLTASQKPYLLIVFGRLGSYDKFVGIPVREFNITGAKVIIETGQENFQIEQSQGTHFFQNMVSTKTGFLHIKYDSKTAFIDWAWLKKQKIAEEKQFFIHTELANPLTIILDGRSKNAVIKKPEKK
jgi:hypothetical protein